MKYASLIIFMTCALSSFAQTTSRGVSMSGVSLNRDQDLRALGFIAVFDAREGVIKQTINGQPRVSAWNDRLGNNHSFYQFVSTNMPVYTNSMTTNALSAVFVNGFVNGERMENYSLAPFFTGIAKKGTIIALTCTLTNYSNGRDLTFGNTGSTNSQAGHWGLRGSSAGGNSTTVSSIYGSDTNNGFVTATKTLGVSTNIFKWHTGQRTGTEIRVLSNLELGATIVPQSQNLTTHDNVTIGVWKRQSGSLFGQTSVAFSWIGFSTNLIEGTQLTNFLNSVSQSYSIPVYNP